jgi:hypothetical protein
LVKPTTVEQALTLTVPAEIAEVIVRRPVALIEAFAGLPGSDQVTVCEGLLVPITAAENCSDALPVAGRTRNGLGGVTFTCCTVAAGAELMVIVALPQTDVTTVEHA